MKIVNKLITVLALVTAGLFTQKAMSMTGEQVRFLGCVEAGDVNSVLEKIQSNPVLLDDQNFADECMNFVEKAVISLDNALNGESPKFLPGQPNPEWHTLINNCKKIGQILQGEKERREPDHFNLSDKQDIEAYPYASEVRHSQIHPRTYLPEAQYAVAQPVALEDVCPVQISHKSCPHAHRECVIL